MSSIRANTGSTSETAELAGAVSQLVVARDLILLSGDLGAGKTAFSKGFGRGLGVDAPITSPTFALIQQYDGRLRMYHLDVYRIGSLEETIELGLSELLDDEAVTLIEWGETILPALPRNYLEVTLRLGDGDDDRSIEFSSIGPSWASRQSALRSALSPWLSTSDETDPQC